MKYLKTYEDISNDIFLYHGTSKENAEQIINGGITEPIYLGDEDIAKDYAISYLHPVLIKFIMSDIQNQLEPNTTLLNYYYDVLEENDNDDDATEVISEWENSKKSWEDSLNILGSVILPPIYISVTYDDIINI